LARVLGRPAVARVPAAAIGLLLGEMGRSTVLASQRIRPLRLIQEGFEFTHPTLEQALRAELGKERRAPSA
jgi:NAD dependent epimerase/dehydratase family enzyme